MTGTRDESSLTPRQLRAAQRNFTWFSLLNIVSWQLLTGNIITLYALRMGAGDLLVGTLYSLIPLGQLLPLLGRAIVRRLGTVRTMGLFWIARNVLMAPILFAPLFANGPRPEIGIVLIVVSVVGFNVARGIAITGNSTIVGAITTDADRGSFLSRQQVVVSLGSIATGALMGALLQERTPLILYSLLFATGIATGMATLYVIFRLPEPPAAERTGGFLQSVARALRVGNTRRFMLLLAANSFVSSMALPFLIVYVKRAYGQSDSVAMLLTVIGSCGAIVVALMSGFVIDRVGPKPLMSVFTATMAIAIVLVVVAPPLGGPLAVWLYLGAIFFFTTFAANGMASANGVYYYSLIPPSERLNLGVFNFLITGIPASLGSLSGGAILNALAAIETLDTFSMYRAYYGAIVAAYFGISMLTSVIDRRGAYAVHDVLSILVSPREIGAMALLNRLKESRTAEAEESLVQRLASVDLRLAVPDMLRMLKSPRFAVRAETLDTLTGTELTVDLKEALIAEVDTQAFTTAYLAAEIVGRKQMAEGIPALRRGLSSDDFFLSGKCMVALARLGDRDSRETVENLFRDTTNPYLLVHGAAALELFGIPQSLPILLTPLQKEPIAPVRDEVILSAAGILDMADSFYALYGEFLVDRRQGLALLSDYVSERQEQHPLSDPVLETLTSLPRLVDDGPRFQEAATLALDRIPVVVEHVDVTPVLRMAVRHPTTGASEPFRFFVAATAAVHAWRLRIPARSLPRPDHGSLRAGINVSTRRSGDC
ncbi:MAG: MFS transporter [Spirochaetaceae bacterium]|nr:MFS transporter [Spirochaetaceae bacterium]